MANNEHFERARRIVASWPWWKRNNSTDAGQVAQLAVKQALIERQAVEIERLRAELFEAREQVTGLTEALHGTQAENDRLVSENKIIVAMTPIEQACADGAKIAAALEARHATEPLRPCFYVFRSHSCGYQGPDTQCKGTFEDCHTKGNAERFGGYPIRVTEQQIVTAWLLQVACCPPAEAAAMVAHRYNVSEREVWSAIIRAVENWRASIERNMEPRQ